MSPLRQLRRWPYLLGTILLSVGCQNQPAQIANPFYSADRVPPPATRSLAPGTGQPYYPGDPLPAMPGGAPVPLGQSSEPPATPLKPLEWETPETASAAPPPPISASFAANTAQTVSAEASSATPATSEVLPVAWDEDPPQSTTPRVRLPQSTSVPNAAEASAQYPRIDQATVSADGFRPRGARKAPY